MRKIGLVSVLVGVVASSPASAYEVKTTGSGAVVRWGRVDIKVRIDAPEEAKAPVMRAFDAWIADLPVEATFRYVGGEPTGRGLDGISSVTWRDNQWDEDLDDGLLAVTLSLYDSHSGRMVDSDILINGAHYPFITAEVYDGLDDEDMPGADNHGNGDDDGDGHDDDDDEPGDQGYLVQCEGEYDLQGVMTHEVGHLLGLAHEKVDTTATMYPGSGTCDKHKRTLSDDDVAGVVFLYEGTEALPEGDITAFACSATGRSASGTAGAVLLLLVVSVSLRRRRQLTIVAATFLAATLAADRAEASTVQLESVQELAQRSDVVVRGTVVMQRAERRGARIYTLSVIEVTECWRGHCQALSQRLTVRQLGGTFEGLRLEVSGTGEFTLGADVVVMLRERSDGDYTPVGMAMGVFRISIHRGIPTATRDISGLRIVTRVGRTFAPPTSWSLESLRILLAKPSVQQP